MDCGWGDCLRDGRLRPDGCEGPRERPGPPTVVGDLLWHGDGGGSPVPDGYVITARIGDYLSQPIEIRDGNYVGLQVAAPTTAHVGRDITFLIGDEPANEKDAYHPTGTPSFKSLNLTFGRLPSVTPTPVATATPTAEAGETPVAPPSPPPGGGVPNASTYSGRLSAAGAEIPEGMELVARIGSYASEPALVKGDSYSGLVVNPADATLVNGEIEFFLSGIRSATTATFRGGEFIENFTLVFFGFPTPTPAAPAATPTPTPTRVPPTPVPPTPVPPTPVPPTPVPPTPVPADIRASHTSRADACAADACGGHGRAAYGRAAHASAAHGRAAHASAAHGRAADTRAAEA